MLADEVYEHVLYDGRVHQSVMNHPELQATQLRGVFLRQDAAHHRLARRLLRRAAELTRELRKVHQFNAFSIAAPLQEAIRLYLERQPDAWREVGAFFSAKRDLLLRAAGGQRPCAAAGAGQLFPARRLWPLAGSPTAVTWNSPNGSSTRPVSR